MTLEGSALRATHPGKMVSISSPNFMPVNRLPGRHVSQVDIPADMVGVIVARSMQCQIVKDEYIANIHRCTNQGSVFGDIFDGCPMILLASSSGDYFMAVTAA